MNAPHEIRTARLLLRKPSASDADEIFRRYASDASVGRYLAWPTHRTIEDTHAFLQFSDDEWQRCPAGPYLVWSSNGERLIGSTGLAFDNPQRASTGYVFARDAWSAGYATEAVAAMQQLAEQLGVLRLYAYCHPENGASRRVLEKCGFEQEGTLRRYCAFPNLSPGELFDVVLYSWLPRPD